MKRPATILCLLCGLSFSLAEIHAEETPNQLLTTLGSTTLRGYVTAFAHWRPSAAPLPQNYFSLPIVFVAAPIAVRERSNRITGASRRFQFTVHRFGGRTNETMVYLNFHSGDVLLGQGAVTIPAGERRATSTWLLPDNRVRETARAFTATISLDPVRLGLPGSEYRLSTDLPRSATVVLLDPSARSR